MIKKTTIESAALSFARIDGILATATKLGRKDMYKTFITNIFKDMTKITPDCEFGLLWNAATEKNSKEVFKELTLDQGNNIVIQADSGGLQEITLGKPFTPAEKQGIYKRQALYSTRAMSFDKMPIIVDHSKTTSAVDLSNRYFVLDLLYDCGRESGANVVKQCEVFLDTPDRISKIMVILQGHTFEDYKEYARGVFSVFDELDEETRQKYYSVIGGLSFGLGGTSNYFNLLEVIVRTPMEMDFVPEELRSEIHFLGLGGLTKAAFIYALQPDFYGRDVHFTFDSTSRTSAATYGRYTLHDKEKKTKQVKSTGRDYGENAQEFLTLLYENFKENINRDLPYRQVHSLEDYRQKFSAFREDGHRTAKEMKKQGCDEPFIDDVRLGGTLMSDFVHWLYETKVFMNILQDFSEGNFTYLSNKKLAEILNAVKEVPTYEEYMLPKNRGYYKLVLEKIRVSDINIIQSESDIEHLSPPVLDEW